MNGWRTSGSTALRRAVEARSLSWWGPLAALAGTRVFTWLVVLHTSSRQISLSHGSTDGLYIHTSTPAGPDYWEVAGNWDGQWYELIATEGYQPRSADVTPSERDHTWAFPPLFPYAVRALTYLVNLEFTVAASIMNVVLAYVGLVMLFWLLYPRGGRFLGMAGVLTTCCFISAPLFQFAYSEAMAFALLMASLLALQSRRYAVALVAVESLALTRSITPPVSIVAAALIWGTFRDSTFRNPMRDRIWLSIVALAAFTGVWTWPAIARLMASSGGAAADRADLSKRGLGWLSQLSSTFGWLGMAFVVLVVLILALIAASRWTKDWGLASRTWLWSYPGFLMVAAGFHSGIFRYLLLCPPLALLPLGSRDVFSGRSRVIGLAVACVVGLVLQSLWISNSFIITSHPLVP